MGSQEGSNPTTIQAGVQRAPRVRNSSPVRNTVARTGSRAQDNGAAATNTRASDVSDAVQDYVDAMRLSQDSIPPSNLASHDGTPRSSDSSGRSNATTGSSRVRGSTERSSASVSTSTRSRQHAPIRNRRRAAQEDSDDVPARRGSDAVQRYVDSLRLSQQMEQEDPDRMATLDESLNRTGVDTEGETEDPSSQENLDQKMKDTEEQLMKAKGASGEGFDLIPTQPVRQVSQVPGAYPSAPSRPAGREISQDLSQGVLEELRNLEPDIDHPFDNGTNPASVGQENESSMPILEAVPVTDDDVRSRRSIEAAVRQRILQEAVQADVVQVEDLETGGHFNDEPEEKPVRKSKGPSRMLAILLLVLLIVGVGLAIGLSRRGKSDDESEQVSLPESSSGLDVSSSLSTSLEQIKERGHIRCGMYVDHPGYGYQDRKTGEYSGFNFQLCRAVAAAVFADGDSVEVVPVNAGNRFARLGAGEVDLISQATTFTMGRDILEFSTGQGFSFSYPFYFSGLGFGGIQEFVECADRLDPFHGVCRGLKVCVTMGTTQEAIVNELLPGPVAVRFSDPTDALLYMTNGTCNVIAAEPILMQPLHLKQAFGLFLDEEFVLGNNSFSKDPLSLVTLDSDPRVSDIVNSVVKIMYAAQGMNISRDNVMLHDFDPSVPTALKNRFKDVISAVGNTDELYEAEAAHVLPKHGVNTLNRHHDTGLLWSFPFGRVDEVNPEEAKTSATMDRLQISGVLKCGISGMEQGFAWYNPAKDEWSGLHVELCRGLAAALFAGDVSKVDFVVVETLHRFHALQNGTVDVLMGEQASLANEFFEPSTGNAYSFSSPYFHGSNSTGNSSSSILAMATRREDNLWSSFVYWIIMALIYAEEQSITSSNAIEMPTVNVFGVGYVQCFRDLIGAIGNYGDLYNTSLATVLPRSGGNLLNKAPYSPQQEAFPLH
ncbi:Putative amino-acid ABC transporter-binding protein YhdW [Seminavis robusta]|uniref:Amino-acid ABC transporter-binding protein YhdW n=1 Tax=Seminavis robusta TaxID=568900 RepID=A0A9N8EAY7_9STRA|nr:Putative amino-acid ABC transporter-binding protein YhdW [Seminavis robusta]|eukprot:Sro701_g189820.1 Putative amino-acid ABC transporter-binding protein YhdW (943) ;mRNA; r:31763-34820